MCVLQEVNLLLFVQSGKQEYVLRPVTFLYTVRYTEKAMLHFWKGIKCKESFCSRADFCAVLIHYFWCE